MQPNFSRVFALLILIALGLGAYGADVYKTVDEQGRVTYTDTPPQGKKAEKVDLPELNSLPPTRGQARETPPPTIDTIPRSYEVMIVSPQPEAHVNPGEMDLGIQVATEPAVYPRHTIQILDNGEVISVGDSGTTIQNIFRGTHAIQARVVDENGRILGQSAPVNVYVHRPTVNSPARAN